MAWFKDWFGEDYLKVYPHRDEAEARRQIDFVEKVLPLQSRQRILDLGCGNGRHSAELAKRGYEVTCLDLSSVLIRLAKERSKQEGCCSHFVRADMRNVPFGKVFDAVLSFFTTFGYFHTDAENMRTLANIESVLVGGGHFLLDYLNREHVIANLVPSDFRAGEGFEIVQERRYNRKEERIEKKVVLQEKGETREYFESVRLYSLTEMRALFAHTRLELTQTFGDFEGHAFTNDSPRLILVGRLASA